MLSGEESIEAKEERILNIIIKQKNQPSFNQKEALRLLAEKERLRFHCDHCDHEWMKMRPDEHVVRSADGTNFYICMGDDEDGIRTYIYCPSCGKHDKIRRRPVVKLDPHPRKRIFRPDLDDTTLNY